MNKLLIPLVILLGSLLYSLFWNKVRQPECLDSTETTILAPVIMQEKEINADLEAKKLALFEPLDIYFQTASSNIIRTPELNDWLTLAKEYLAENPNEKLDLVGHSDSDGSNELNQGLSEQRAERVKSILTADGFSENNLITSGKGELEPKGDNTTAEGKAENRRVSIKLIK